MRIGDHHDGRRSERDRPRPMCSTSGRSSRERAASARRGPRRRAGCGWRHRPRISAQPSMRIGQDADGHIAGGDDAGPRDVALESAAVAEPVPAGDIAAHDSEAVITFHRRMRVAPVLARHLAAAGGREHASLRVWRELREEAGDVGCRADEAAAGAIAWAGLSPGMTRRRSSGSREAVAARERVRPWRAACRLWFRASRRRRRSRVRSRRDRAPW